MKPGKTPLDQMKRIILGQRARQAFSMLLLAVSAS